jgi:hypothetical protein
MLCSLFAFQNPELFQEEDGSWKCKSVPYTVCYLLKDLTGKVKAVRRFRPIRMARIYKRGKNAYARFSHNGGHLRILRIT